MPEPLDVWIGKDEVGGVPSQPRKDLKPPPHWRLEAVAATERPRSLDRSAPTAARPSSSRIATPPTSGCSSSTDRTSPQRLTTGRDPMPYWEDTEPRSRRTARRSPTPTEG